MAHAQPLLRKLPAWVQHREGPARHCLFDFAALRSLLPSPVAPAARTNAQIIAGHR